MLAGLALGVHLVVILFNVFGLVAVPLGAWRGWRFVRIRWWRILHIAALVAVAAQAVLGRACFLTIWQAALEGEGAAPKPLIQRWVEGAIFWNLPGWAFAAMYLAVLAYAVAMLWAVPPRR